MIPGSHVRDALSGDSCAVAAPVFDTLSTRIAELHGWNICKLSGSIAKAAALAMPDGLALTNMSDIVSICQSICRATDVDLILDIDDGGGTALTVQRTVQELEAAGAAAIEIEDNPVPRYFGEATSRHSLLVPVQEQVGRLQAAVAARRCDATVIIARTGALGGRVPTPEDLDRVAAYSKTGVDAIMLPTEAMAGITREKMRSIHSAVAPLPLIVLGLPNDMISDEQFLAENLIRIRYIANKPTFRIAVQALDDCFDQLRHHDSLGELETRLAPDTRIQEITRTFEYQHWSERYTRVAQ